MRIPTHGTAILAVIVSTVLLAGCVNGTRDREANEAFANLVGGAGEAAVKREETTAEERKKKQERAAFRRRLQEQQEGEGDSGGGSTDH